MCGSASDRMRAMSWGETVIEGVPSDPAGAAGIKAAAPFTEPPTRAKEGADGSRLSCRWGGGLGGLPLPVLHGERDGVRGAQDRSSPSPRPSPRKPRGEGAHRTRRAGGDQNEKRRPINIDSRTGRSE